MSAITIDISDSLYSKLDKRMRAEHITLQEFAVSALAEKLSNILTADYLEQRVSRGDIEHFRKCCREYRRRTVGTGSALRAPSF